MFRIVSSIDMDSQVLSQALIFTAVGTVLGALREEFSQSRGGP